MKKTIVLTLFLLVIGIVSAIPYDLTFHGWGIRNGGVLLNESHNITAKIYYASTGGSAQLTETYTNKNISNGEVDLILHSVGSLNTSQSWFLDVTIDSTTLTPRSNITSSVQSLLARNVSWSNIVNMPAGFADGTDDTGAGGNSTEQIRAAINNSGAYNISIKYTTALAGFNSSLSIETAILYGTVPVAVLNNTYKDPFGSNYSTFLHPSRIEMAENSYEANYGARGFSAWQGNDYTQADDDGFYVGDDFYYTELLPNSLTIYNMTDDSVFFEVSDTSMIHNGNSVVKNNSGDYSLGISKITSGVTYPLADWWNNGIATVVYNDFGIEQNNGTNQYNNIYNGFNGSNGDGTHTYLFSSMYAGDIYADKYIAEDGTDTTITVEDCSMKFDGFRCYKYATDIGTYYFLEIDNSSFNYKSQAVVINNSVGHTLKSVNLSNAFVPNNANLTMVNKSFLVLENNSEIRFKNYTGQDTVRVSSPRTGVLRIGTNTTANPNYYCDFDMIQMGTSYGSALYCNPALFLFSASAVPYSASGYYLSTQTAGGRIYEGGTSPRMIELMRVGKDYADSRYPIFAVVSYDKQPTMSTEVSERWDNTSNPQFRVYANFSQAYQYLRLLHDRSQGHLDVGNQTYKQPLNISSESVIITSLNAASCDVNAYPNGTLYCGTDATGAGGNSTAQMINAVNRTSDMIFGNLTTNSIWIDSNAAYDYPRNLITEESISISDGIVQTKHAGIYNASGFYFFQTGNNTHTTKITPSYILMTEPTSSSSLTAEYLTTDYIYLSESNSATDNKSYIDIYNNNGDWEVGINHTGNFYIREFDNESYAMYIAKGTRNVGINKSSPASALDVNGKILANDVEASNNVTGKYINFQNMSIFNGTNYVGTMYASVNTADYVTISTSFQADNFYTNGLVYVGSDIYTTGTGDDFWLGTTTQSSANFQAYANGTVKAKDWSNVSITTSQISDYSASSGGNSTDQIRAAVNDSTINYVFTTTQGNNLVTSNSSQDTRLDALENTNSTLVTNLFNSNTSMDTRMDNMESSNTTQANALLLKLQNDTSARLTNLNVSTNIFTEQFANITIANGSLIIKDKDGSGTATLYMRDDYLYITGATTEASALIGSTAVLSYADIYTTGSGDDFWLGSSTQSSANFRGYATGELYTSVAVNTTMLNTVNVEASNNITTTNLNVVCNAAKTTCWKTYVDAGGNLITVKV